MHQARVIIADDDPHIGTALSHYIHTREHQFKTIGMAFNGEDLLNKIIEVKPDIVITDIDMPIMDGLEVIRRITKMGIPCKFIIISEYRKFEYIYDALKYDVAAYLLKPVIQDELNAALNKIAWQIQHISYNLPIGNDRESRDYFVHTGALLLAGAPMPVEDVNTTYSTHFGEGCFQVVMIRIDHDNRPKKIPESTSLLHQEVQDIMQQHLGQYCIDIVISSDWDDIFAHINYPEENRKAVQDELSKLLGPINKVTKLDEGLTATLCVGGIYPDICKLDKSKKEATYAAWMRMELGIGKVIVWGKPSVEYSISLHAKLQELDGRVRKAFETLNTKEFVRCINELFSFSKPALGGQEVKDFIKIFPKVFFEVNTEMLAAFPDADRLKNEIQYALRTVTTFESLKDVLITQFSSLIDQVRTYVESKNTKPVRQAIDYVKKNYSKPVRLETAASEVGLSPTYFSSIFKKETGQNFSDYVTEYRLIIAKDLLKSSDLNINEIANALGFSDWRYFSKLFKKTEGIKPTEYRKIHA